MGKLKKDVDCIRPPAYNFKPHFNNKFIELGANKC